MENKWNGLDRKYDGKEESKERSYIFDFPWEGYMVFFLRSNAIIPGIIGCAVLR